MLQIASAGAGFLLVAATLLADRLGLSAGEGFSRNQVLILIAGLILLATAALGRRSTMIYRQASMILLNLLLLFLALEILSLIVIKLWTPDELQIRHRKELSGGLLEDEVSSVLGHYESFLVWHADPYLSGDETTDSRGLRTTPGASTDPRALKVFVFGGSSIWGEGVPDSCTVASYLQGLLEEELDRAVTVTNFGQISWVSTQDLLCLMFEIRDGNIPDVAVFCNGFNDFWSSYQSGRPGEHQNFSRMSERVEGRDILRLQSRLLMEVLARTCTGQAIHLIGTGGLLRQDFGELVTLEMRGIDVPGLAESTFTLYRENMDIAETLGECYGFECCLIWQPVIWCGSKTLTSHEDSIWIRGLASVGENSDPACNELLLLTREHASTHADSTEGFHDFSTIFDSVTTPVYTDMSGCHLNPEGNRILAGEIVRILVRDPALREGEMSDLTASGVN